MATSVSTAREARHACEAGAAGRLAGAALPAPDGRPKGAHLPLPHRADDSAKLHRACQCSTGILTGGLDGHSPAGAEQRADGRRAAEAPAIKIP